MGFPKRLAALPTWFPYKVRDRHLQPTGINQAWWVTHQSYGRQNCQYSPYLIANEWICGHLANALRIPTPPFAIMKDPGKSGRMFSSLLFGASDIPPDDAIPEKIVQALPYLSSGIVAFDIWIANWDRTRLNLLVDAPEDPRHLFVIDHERALMGHQKGKIRHTLSGRRHKLGIDNHCLAPLIRSLEHFPNWLHRIRSISFYYLLDLCDELQSLGISRKDAEATRDFLESRKNSIGTLMRSNKEYFPSVQHWIQLP